MKKQIEFRSWFYDRFRIIASSSRMNRFIARHSRLITFIKERLSPESYLGLHLTAGLVISAACIWLFGDLTEGVINNERITAFDDWVLNNILYFRTATVTKIMIIITQIGEWTTVLLASLPIAIYCL